MVVEGLSGSNSQLLGCGLENVLSLSYMGAPWFIIISYSDGWRSGCGPSGCSLSSGCNLNDVA